MLRLLPLVCLPLLMLVPAHAKSVFHPHFPKTIEMTLGIEGDPPKLSVSHLTVTFDRAGFEKAKAGDVWHFANGHFKTPVALKVGGKDVPPGNYRLLARKTEKAWELLLDPKGKDFSRDVSGDAIALDTRFEPGHEVNEHLRLDLQPSGAKDKTELRLEAHFDQYLAYATLEQAEEK